MVKKTEITRTLNYEFTQNGITIPEFTWKYLKLNAIECFIYGFMYSFKTINYTLDNLCRLTGISSENTMQKYLDRLVKEDLIRKKVVHIMTNRKRTIYTNCYDKYGKLDDDIINGKYGKYGFYASKLWNAKL